MNSHSDYSDDDSLDLYKIRSELNLDDEVDEAYDLFRRINKQYNLEGNKMDWFVCALYTVCRKCTTQTIGKSTKIEGNLVSLTNILRSCETSLVSFFSKIKNWIQMDNIPADMKTKIDQLEKNFNVTAVIFNKYKPMFEHVFQCPSQVSLRFENRNRKQYRKQPLVCHDVFSFCWNLFVYFKSKYSQISHDLVNSYHLLIVCLDFCFSSVLALENYESIINTNFYDMLSKELNGVPRSLNNDSSVSIIDILCKSYPGIPIEIKEIKKHFFKPHLDELINNKHLRKRTNGILDIESVDSNFKYIKKEYESFVLNIGEVDESVFFREDAVDILGILNLQSDLEDRFNFLFQRIDHDRQNNLMPMTPLSWKQYNDCRTPVNKSAPLTPISTATLSISRLHSIVIGCKNGPNENLILMFKDCENDPLGRIEKIIKNMGKIFIDSYLKNYQLSPKTSESNKYTLIGDNEFIHKRLELAEIFFYKILEKLLTNESRQRIPESQLTQTLLKIVKTEVFIRSLFACSLEIILYSYNLSIDAFPWILNIYDSTEFKIHPFHFYKVIEPIIRDERSLSIEVVKHLNTIEEKILEQLAWTSDSPVWNILSKTRAPTCLEVSLNFYNIHSLENASSVINSPVVKSYRQHSVNSFSNADLPKRQLFAETSQTNGLSTKIPNQAIKTENGNVTQSIVSPTNSSGESSKFGQFGLFFRKVYNLASLRLRDLCVRLKINAEDIQLKIWTLLENALNSHTILICDHHLDQIIMCSIFVICKINLDPDHAIFFEDIIKYYRLQPQAVSKVYRKVLLSSDNVSETSQNNVNVKSEGDIIKFYNQVFIREIPQSYILQFSSREKKSPPLSPMPSSKLSSQIQSSPLRQVSNYPVFVSPLRAANVLFSPRRQMSCLFQNNQNPSKDLKAINSMMLKTTAIQHNDKKASIATAFVLGQNRVSKRIFQDDQESDGLSNKSFCSMNRKVLAILSDRQIISASSSTNASVTEDSNDSIQMSSTNPTYAINTTTTTHLINTSSSLTSTSIINNSNNIINDTNINIPTINTAQIVTEL